MSAVNNGGPAFPVPYHPLQEWENPTGMALRDYFAAKAMESIIAKLGPYADDELAPATPPGLKEDAPNIDQVSQYAYAQADAMLRARDAAHEEDTQ